MPKQTPAVTITLKKVKLFRGHDGTGLDCDLYVNGIKTAHVFDSAHGAEVEFRPYGMTLEEGKANRVLLQMAEDYAKNLPEEPCIFEAGKTVPQCLESVINKILIEMEEEKQMKKFEKKFPTNFVLYDKAAGTIRSTSFGKPVAVPLSTIPIARLQETYNNLKTSLKGGEVIINTNLTALGIIL